MLTISNPDKVLFPDADITKGELADYYSKVATRMLPYIRNRGFSLVMCPSGIGNDCFYVKRKRQGSYQKNNKTGEPLDPISTVEEVLTFVQNNAIEFHMYLSEIESLPDVLVFDLDPDEGMNLTQVRKGVRDLKSLLDELGFVSFLKTSGNKGYHIVVPVKAEAEWETFSSFAKNIAIVMEKKWPKLYTTNIRKANRKGRIFVDWIRNTKGATAVVPYSVRAKTGARVSMPIGWDELETVAPDGITIKDALNRFDRNPWEKYFTIRMTQWLKQ